MMNRVMSRVMRFESILQNHDARLLVADVFTQYFYFIVSWPGFRISKIEGSFSTNFALQSTNSLKKSNHFTDL